jgi:hypothetical protein
MVDGLIELRANNLKRFKIFNLLLQWVHQEEVVIKSQEEFKLNLL